MVECTLFMTHCLRLNLQLHTISLVRTCRISSFCTVAWQLARLLLTRHIARSLGDSWASCFGLLLTSSMKAVQLERRTVSAVCTASDNDQTSWSLNCFKCFWLFRCEARMTDRACIFHHRSDNCFVTVNKVGLWYTGLFIFWRNNKRKTRLGSYCGNVIAPSEWIRKQLVLVAWTWFIMCSQCSFCFYRLLCVCVFFGLLFLSFALAVDCCINCLYLYEPVMLSTVPCLH